MDWLKIISPGAHGNADLSAHFFRRAYSLLRNGGTMGLIATNTIGQGDTRESGLRYLLQERSGEIYNARRRVKWPGEAAVVVSTVHVSKGAVASREPVLDGRPVSRISAFVREGDFDETPDILEANAGKAFIGSYILGMGFTFDDESAEKGKASSIAEMEQLISKDPRNAQRIKPYLGGSEVNTDPEHKHHRYVIDFEDFPLRRDTSLKSWGVTSDHDKREMLQSGVVSGDYPEPVAADWPDLLEIIERMVKPERDKIKDDFGKKFWWRFLRSRPELHSAIRGLSRVIVTARVSSNLSFSLLNTEVTYNEKTVVFASDDVAYFAVLSSRLHELWTRAFTSTLKDDLNYAHSDCFANFAFPLALRQIYALEASGDALIVYRRELLVSCNSGLTSTYNRFHDPLERKPDIIELRRLHAEMDDAVLRAYGWDDLADLAQDTSEGGAAPRFLHRTDEPEYAYQKRYHWPAWFRDKVLARLLELNRARAAEEALEAKGTRDGKMKPSALQLDQQGTLI